jgi:hypothetical protein
MQMMEATEMRTLRQNGGGEERGLTVPEAKTLGDNVSLKTLQNG